MPGYAHTWVSRQYSLQPSGRLRGPIGDNHLAGMDAVTDPNPAAMMDAYPGCSTDSVNHRIQQRPIGDRI